MCRRQLVELEQLRPEFEAKNAQIVALAHQNQADAAATVKDAGVKYPILADADHAIGDLYNVFNKLGDGAAAPAVFIIDRSGQIIWQYIGKDFADRPAVKTILAKVP